MTIDDILSRVTSVCTAAPFRFTPAQQAQTFDLEPNDVIDGCVRVTGHSQRTRGGFNYTEERTDSVVIWVARAPGNDPPALTRQFGTDVSSLRAAIVRDGSLGGYFVEDGGAGWSVEYPPHAAYAVLRLTLPVNYEASL